MDIPKDIHLPRPEYPTVIDIARDLLQQAHVLQAQRVPVQTQVVEKLPDSFVKAMTTIATNVWRIRSKVIGLDGSVADDISKEDLRKVARYIDTMFESLGSIGIEIKDRTGEHFDYGMPEKVVMTLPQPGINKERIVETLRPTIYWRSQIAQLGEVVIASPTEVEETPEKQTPNSSNISDPKPPNIDTILPTLPEKTDAPSPKAAAATEGASSIKPETK